MSATKVSFRFNFNFSAFLILIFDSPGTYQLLITWINEPKISLNRSNCTLPITTAVF
jgi:hypothetical protein